MKVKIENIDCNTSSEVYKIIGKIIAAIDKECVSMEILIDALSVGSMASVIFCVDEKTVLANKKDYDIESKNETIL